MVALGLTGALVGFGTIAAFPQAASAAGCTKSWTATTSASWATPGDWTPSGVPASSDDVCITAAGTYTVSLNSSVSVNSLTLGGASGTQTLSVAGDTADGNASLSLAAASTVGANGVFDMTSSSASAFALVAGGSIENSGTILVDQGSGGTRYLRSPITNDPGANMTISAADTRDDQANPITNNGTLTVTASGSFTVNGAAVTNGSGATLSNAGVYFQQGGTFTQSGGTISGSNAPTLDGVTVADSAGTGALSLVGSNTLSGTVPAGQTVTVLGDTAQGNAVATLSGTVTNDGTVTLDSTNAAAYAMIIGGAIDNFAAINVNQGSGGIRYLRSNLINEPAGSITLANGNVVADYTTAISNGGTFTIAAGGAVTTNGTAFTNAAGGSFANSGTYHQSSGTFAQSGATLTGTPPELETVAVTDSAGTGALDLVGSNSLFGTIPAGQTVTVLGDTAHGNAVTTLNGTVTNDGTLTLDSTSAASYSLITGTAGPQLDNHGTMNLSQGSGGIRYVRVPLTNEAGGTVVVDSSDVLIDQSTAVTNDGALVVHPGGAASLTGVPLTDNAGSTVANAGVLTDSSGTVTQSGGSLTANPVVLVTSALVDSGGTGALELVSGGSVSGTIPAGQTVTVLGDTAHGNSGATLNGTVTNDGTLTLDSTSAASFALIAGGSLDNFSTVHVNQGAGGIRYLRTPITNESTGTVTIGSPSAISDYDDTFTNSGLVQVADGAHLTMSGTFTNTASGTLGGTVNGSSGSSGYSGGTFVLGGTLQVLTVGAPGLGNAYSIVSGATVGGSFSAFSYPNADYTVAITPSAVNVTVVPPFTLSTPNFTAQRDMPFTTKVATVTDLPPAASYTASINWGDHLTSSGTFTPNGTGGTFAGTHNYLTTGTFSVVTTVHASDGTTISQTSHVKVTLPPAPKAKSVSPKAIGRNSTVTLTITGSNFTAHAAPSFSASGIRVTSTTRVSATTLVVKVKASATAKLGSGNVTVATVGGKATCKRCLKVDAAPKVKRVSPSALHGHTTVVHVTGSGFKAGLKVTSTISGATLGAPTHVRSGSFTISVTVPSGTAPGVYVLTVTNPDFGRGTGKVNVS
jgi:hypothetical protein